MVWFCLAIRELKGLECKVNAIPTISYPTPAKRPSFSLLDKTKIRRTYNLNIPYWKESLAVMLIKKKYNISV